MKSYVTQADLKEKFCIHCLFYDLGMCALTKNKVSGEPEFSAYENRNSFFRCFGRKWQKDPSFIVKETKDEANLASFEDQVSYYMETAQKIVKGEIGRPIISNGFLEEAIRRASK